MWEVTERVGKRGKERDGMQGARDNAASREIVEATPAFVCVCVWANAYVDASGRLRDLPPPLLRAAGFWQQQRRRFRGWRGGDERERVGRMDGRMDEEEEEEEKGGRISAAAPAPQPCGHGGVTSGLIGCAF